jgi:hypothetical protein
MPNEAKPSFIDRMKSRASEIYESVSKGNPVAKAVEGAAKASGGQKVTTPKPPTTRRGRQSVKDSIAAQVKADEQKRRSQKSNGNKR